MKNLNHFLRAVLAGICVGIAVTVNLSIDNKIAGALLFTVALFIIVTNGLNLFTGKVGYILDNPPSFLGFTGFVWLGNLAGAAGTAFALRATRISNISEKASAICEVKLGDTLLSAFILAAFCGILLYVATDGYINGEYQIGKFLGLFLCISAFVLAGFEHCIANMFYFTLAGAWSPAAVLHVIIVSLGNTVGSLLIPLVKKTGENAA